MESRFRQVTSVLLVALLLPQIAGGSDADPATERVRLTPQLLDSVAQLFDLAPVSVRWKYHPGDDTAWANPWFDDTNWEEAYTTLDQDSMPAGGWTGIGWFRLHLAVDPRLVGVPLAFRLAQMGAAELYLDGELIYTGGNVSRSPAEEVHYIDDYPDPGILVIDDSVCALAVRFSNHRSDLFHTLGDPAGFGLELASAEARIKLVARYKLYIEAHQWLFTGACSVLALVFLLIYFFSRRSREDLFFALLAIGCALLSYCPFEFHNGVSLAGAITADFLFKLGLVMVGVFGLRFLYELFYLRLPRQYWVFLAVGLVMLALSRMLPISAVYIFVVAAILEMLRAVIVAVVHRRQGALVIALGFVLFGLGSTYQVMLDWQWVPQPPDYLLFPYMAGILALLVTMSYHLARQFARTNAELTVQLAQVRDLSEKTIQQEVTRKLLEKDIEHKRKELEESRKLQQAMADLKQAHEELQQTQTQLVQSEKMASLGMLVAGIAHEINTPVGAISSMHDTLVRAMEKLKEVVHGCEIRECDAQQILPLTDVIDDANRVIEQGAERVITIVRRLRSFARLDEAELKEVDIHEGLEDTLTLIHHEIKNRITVVREYGDLPVLTCYPGRLNQVFLNLLNNARQAIDGEGTITVGTAVRDGWVEVRFADTGKGIAPENLARIFDPGFTTKGVRVGTGLGLSICYRIIQDHRGEIKVESEVDRGTTFTLLLPTDLDDRIGAESDAAD